MFILHISYAEKKIVIIHHSWIIQYSIFCSNFQKIYRRKDNSLFIDNEKVNEYTADSYITYGRIYNGSIPDMRAPISQKIFL